MIFEEELANVKELIKMCIQENRADRKLQICHNICQIMEEPELPKELKKELGEMEKFSKDLLTNPQFRRAVNKRTALMEREPVTYFGQELPKGDEYDFDEELENEITAIDFRITLFVGRILKHIQMSGEF